MSKNQRLINVSIYKSHIVLTSTMRTIPLKPNLVVDRNSPKISEGSTLKWSALEEELGNYGKVITSKNASAFLGVYRTKESRYLVLCDDST